MSYNISQLKNHLGAGLGLRKNRYLIEIPMPTIDGETLNLLCQSAGFPERTNTTTDIWHKGRRYTVRGETDFGGEYDISILDDSDMRIRYLFDLWMKQVDNTRPNPNDSLLSGSFEGFDNIVEEVAQGVAAANAAINTISNPTQLLNFTAGLLDSNKGIAAANYQTDINIWQLDGKNQKVYGYKLQNAFPKSIGDMSLEDSDENSLSEFRITFAFSEFIPLKDTNREIVSSIFGDRATDAGNALTNLIS